ncbi:MAG TPA: hypothetical protein DDY49_07410 [Paenibacillaceae bacterium]|nr:hypothetical protein [Paenibacillaceae bacterium]
MKKTITSFLFWVPYSFFIYFLYHLIFIPSLLEYSYLGFWGLILLLGIILFLLKPDERKPLLVFTLLFLLLIKSFAGMEKIESYWKTFLFYGFVFILSFLIARFYGKLSYTAVASLLLLSLLLNTLFIRSELPLLTQFSIKWVSDKLYTGSTTEFFPILLKEINKDGKPEVITLGNTDAVKELKEKPILKKEQLHIFAFTWDGKSIVRIPENQLDKKSIINDYPIDYVGFPYYVLNEELELTPLTQHEQLTNHLMNFGDSPFYAMYLTMKNLSEQHQKKGTFPDDPFPLPDTEYIKGDVDHDQKDELLVSSTPSAIIKPTTDNHWKVLWTARDQYFRFENYISLHAANKKEMIALEKSLFSSNPTRYVASYDYSPNGLLRNWKVFVSLNNIQAGDFDGDGINEMAAFDYVNRRVVILEKHNLPVLIILSGGLGLLLGILAIRRRRT